ncbi:hypothetical protein KIW84_074946 [Lathyrus oleraceus]|uniref:Fe2OG dioxygenase domain-containing protein n=1 Tax=Pisum sativum TaxID=3888 RepID=A0A9D4VSR2_PEA|nr:hypothetical protein KIW84_074946 [Pisum sativum]
MSLSTDKDYDLSLKIEQGFGPDGLGILSVTDVPGYSSLRRNLLHLAPKLANLPKEVKDDLEDPNSRYPSYCGSNVWPRSTLPELELAFKALGKLIFDVGLMVAYHCDQYGDNSMSSWCGWHTDNGSLTGLTCAIFTRDGEEIPCPDSAAGLYIRTRNDQIVKVVYGVDNIAYQIGETAEILSGGILRATPHCVQAPKGKESSGVERSTFALFMQPDWDEKLSFPEEVHIHKELIPSNASLTYGEYSEMVLGKYYDKK